MSKKQLLNPKNIENPTEKVCYRCHIKKLITEFNKCKTGVYGLKEECRNCQHISKKEWDKNNQEHTREYTKLYRERNREKIATKFKEKYNSDPIWKEKLLSKYRMLKKSEKYKNKTRLWKKKYRAIPHNAIAHNLRSRIRKALRGLLKSSSTEKLLGITFEELKIYLESKFLPGMSWANYGKWHVDHIIPCSHFDLTQAYNQRLCFYYLNLRPLWAKENSAKGDSLPDLYCQTLAKLKAAVNQDSPPQHTNPVSISTPLALSREQTVS